MIKMKKLNNKGFSLVELIIVIAIMAILVGVVGTQVIPYLEKSRQSKDMQIFSAWNTAAMSAYSMNTDKVNGSSIVTITLSDGTFTVTNDSANGDIKSTFKSLTGLDDTGISGVSFSSKAGNQVKTSGSVVISIDVDTSSVTTTISGDTDGVFGTIENK
jgi:type IV pilus assembly protein PilA